MAEDQSRSPLPPRRSSTARCSFCHSPAFVQAANRRCTVGTVTPNDGGKYRHAHPEVRTNTIAVNTARSSAGAVPPPYGLAWKPGTSGSTISHNASGTNRNANESSIPTQ